MEGHLYPLAQTQAVTCLCLTNDYVYTLEAYELCVGTCGASSQHMGF